MKNSRHVLDLSNEEALDFFLKKDSYRAFDLPPYFVFEKLLREVSHFLKGKKLSDLVEKRKAAQTDGVNYTIYASKDGKYAWRPLQLIHPVLYVSLVHLLTEQKNWEEIRARFTGFRKNKEIVCTSIPINSGSSRKDTEEQILAWWRDAEQRSIELSLEYDLMIQTDITDCYGSVYTHSIAWALHDKEVAKENRGCNLVGNAIDQHLQHMNCGQTNGIPQGSVLMNFIAEMVLGYSDESLFAKLNGNVNNYHIIRHRDDYRIFVTSSQDGEKILKALTEVMTELSLKLNTAKTWESKDIISSSIKPGKLAWLGKKQSNKSLQNHLLLIHQHSIEHPNDGSLMKPLQAYCGIVQKRLKRSRIQDILTLISITADIAYRCPRTYRACAAILSRLICHLPDTEGRKGVIDKIKQKFSKQPNTEHMQVWLQRISMPLGIGAEPEQEEKLCLLAEGNEKTDLWNSSWVKCRELKRILATVSIIDQNAIKKLSKVIDKKEFSLFSSGYGS